MHRLRSLGVLGLCAVVGAAWVLGGKTTRSEGYWPQWRGPLGTGVAPAADPPVTWSETHNVRWKTPLPGLGHSTPVIWGDRLFVTTAVAHGDRQDLPADHGHHGHHGHHGNHDDGAHNNMPPVFRHRFVALAVDTATGGILWERTLRDDQPHEGTHETGSWASSSPVTDGKHVIVSFGSQGIFGLTVGGKKIWERDLGDMRVFHGHGEGSSPALHGNRVVVNWDHQDQSFIAALDKRNGKTIWRVDRDEITSWSSPLIVEHDGAHQVIVAATGRVRGYDLETGRVLWECSGLSRNVVATPVAADGFVYVGNSYNRRAMMAIRLDQARGDISGTDAVAWVRQRDTPYVPSPLLYGDTLFYIKHNHGFLTALDAQSGERHYGPQRLADIGEIFSSPVGAADRIYIASRRGEVAVIQRGPTFKALARNRLDDSFSASPAIAGDTLYLRGESNLYAIAVPDEGGQERERRRGGARQTGQGN